MKITPIPRSDNASCKQEKQANYWVKCLAERGNGGVLPNGSFWCLPCSLPNSNAVAGGADDADASDSASRPNNLTTMRASHFT